MTMQDDLYILVRIPNTATAVLIDAANGSTEFTSLSNQHLNFERYLTMLFLTYHSLLSDLVGKYFK